MLSMPTLTASGEMWFFIVKGGPVMIPLIALSVVALTIILAKFWELWRFRVRLNKLSQKLSTLVREGNLGVALHTCRDDGTLLGRLFESAVVYRSQERIDLTRRLERLGGEIVADLESYMTALATLIGIAPMLGFLGTIIGLIKAFMAWESMGERITINILAGGIYEAMITTATGLIVAIPYYLVYNHLVTQIGALTRQTEARAEEFVDLLAITNLREPLRHAL
jgi:biopolymer transport protein ExbB